MHHLEYTYTTLAESFGAWRPKVRQSHDTETVAGLGLPDDHRDEGTSVYFISIANSLKKESFGGVELDPDCILQAKMSFSI